MFYYFYPMNGMYAYEYGTAMSRMLMDMRKPPNGIIRRTVRMFHTTLS